MPVGPGRLRGGGRSLPSPPLRPGQDGRCVAPRNSPASEPPVPWEVRGKHGKRYYYRTRRRNGRMVRQYVGTGPRAEIAAAGDMLQWLDRYQEARAAAEAREFEAELLVFDALCNAIARDEL